MRRGMGLAGQTSDVWNHAIVNNKETLLTIIQMIDGRVIFSTSSGSCLLKKSSTRENYTFIIIL